MIDLLLAAGLALHPVPVLFDDHVWRAQTSGACPSARYGATIAGTEQTFELAACEGDWTLTVVSGAEQAARADLAPGAIVFRGIYNDELAGPEGRLALPGPCGTVDGAPRLSRPWPQTAPGERLTFALAPGCAAPFENVVTFTRLDEAFDAGMAPVPGEGCDDWRIVADGTRDFTAREVRVCFDGSQLTGVADGRQVLEGVIWGLDGTIEAAYTPPAPDGCAPRAYRVTGARMPASRFELEGFQPVIGEACALEGYEDVRLRFEPAGT